MYYKLDNEKIYRMAESLARGINKYCDEGIVIELPNGNKFGHAPHLIKIRNQNTMFELLKNPEMGFGEGYMRGDIIVDGDLEKIIISALRFLSEKDNISLYSIGEYAVRLVLNIVGIIKNKETNEVRKHYDLNNEFYSLWLDESMTYSCAFFKDKSFTLEEAQKEKRKIIFEKLQLREGDRLLDIGCGWGAIILQAYLDYGAHAVGITVSKNQYEYIKSKIKTLGLSKNVEVYLMHYEDLPKIHKNFNKIDYYRIVL